MHFFFIFFFCLISFLTPSSLWGSKAIALFRLCWCKGLQKALIKRWKGIKSRYNLLSLIFDWGALKTFAIYCTLLLFIAQFGISTYSAKISFGKQKCGRSKFWTIIANQLTLLALQVVFVYRPCYKDLFIKIRTTNVVKLLLFLWIRMNM